MSSSHFNETQPTFANSLLESNFMRKVYTSVVVKVVMTLEEGVDVADAISDMDYQFNISEEHGFVEDTEIVDWDVQDSK